MSSKVIVNNKTMEITRKSLISGIEHTLDINITEEQLKEIENPNRTKFIQNIVPHLNANEREFLMSGITEEEWEKEFKEDE